MTFKGFYKKTMQERIDILNQEGKFDDALNIKLDPSIYDHMIENAISTFELPLGVVPEVLINGKYYTIPMATEESSVIAASNHGSKIMNRNGGIKANVIHNLLQGEVIFANPIHKNNLINFLNKHDNLLTIANQAHPSILKRGGGVRKFEVRDLETFVILDVYMDTKEAMGANMMNTVLESLGTYITKETSESILMAILSNLSPESMVEATCVIDPKTLKFSDDTAKRIALSSQLTLVDKYRCATHNKGIMNGIDAVVLASGNDTRAINANLYSYYPNQPFTLWEYKNNQLEGCIKIPLSIGTVGGAIAVHPKAQLFKKISGYKDKENLMEIIASIGLIQNFAALYALNTEGIQKGHMSLHVKNILLSVGCPEGLLEKAAILLLLEENINTDTARKIVSDLI